MQESREGSHDTLPGPINTRKSASRLEYCQDYAFQDV
jgi:hypothetical protein